LAESDKVTLEVARLLRDDFLQQNGFTAYDRYCPFYKTVWMLRNFMTYYNLAQQAIESSTSDTKITWNLIRQHTNNIRTKLSDMKFSDPADGQESVIAKYKTLYEEIQTSYRTLHESHS